MSSPPLGLDPRFRAVGGGADLSGALRKVVSAGKSEDS